MDNKAKLKILIKDSLKAGTMTAVVILFFGIILGGILSVVIKKFLPSNNISNILFVCSGVLVNIIMQNNIASSSLGVLMPTRILLLFIIPAITIYILLKDKIKKENYFYTFLYAIGVGLIVSTLIMLYNALASRFSLVIGSAENAKNITFDLFSLKSFLNSFLKCFTVVIITKILVQDKIKLNSGLRAFRVYLKYIALASFLMAIILEVYLFTKVFMFPNFALPINMTLVLYLTNIMGYIILFVYGGVLNANWSFLNNLENNKISFIQILNRELGMFPMIIYVLSVILIVLILFLSIRKISKDSFIRDGFIFIISSTLFNVILAITTKVIFKFQIIAAEFNIAFVLLPIIVTSLAITFLFCILRYFVIYINKVI